MQNVEIRQTEELVKRYMKRQDCVLVVPETCLHLVAVLNGVEKDIDSSLQKLYIHAEQVGLGLFKAILIKRFGKSELDVEELEKGLELGEIQADDQPLIHDLRTLLQENRLLNAGISFAGKGQIQFNPNDMIRFFETAANVIKMEQRIMIYNRLSGIYEELTEQNLGVLIRYFMNRAYTGSWRSVYERDVLEGLRRSCPVVTKPKYGQLKVTLQNGVYDLVTDELLPQSPEHFQTCQIPVGYQPEADYTKFRKYLADVTCGDHSLENVMQEMMGYVLIDNAKAERAFYLYGPGQNGKSVFANILMALVGTDNASSNPLSMFGKQFGLENVVGKMMNIAGENNEALGSAATEILKAMISGDTISVARKFKQAVSYLATCKLFFLMNTLPDTDDTSHGFFRKVLIVPFNRIFSEDVKNPNLKDELIVELPGILNWALEGAKRLIANNYRFSPSDVVEKAAKDYKAEQNPVELFYKEGLAYNPGARIPRKSVHSAYMRFLEEQGTAGRGTESTQRFWGILDNQAKLLDERHLEYVQIHGNKHLKDYIVNPDFRNRSNSNVTW